tara:strand:- start:585 stop:791 length:207 start_codon:yes stop_codon:yes gene_type:complete
MSEKEMQKEFDKLNSILSEAWSEFTKLKNGQYWFEIENELMTSYGYSYSNQCEWVKKINNNLYNFGSF